MLNFLSYIPTRAKALAILWIMLASIALPLIPAQGYDGRECIPNSVLNCGVYSKDEFKAKWNNGDGRQTAAEIQRDFNMLSINLSEFMSAGTVANGVVTKAGNVLVGGKVVANNAWSFGRTNMPGSTPVGHLFKRRPSVSFKSDQLEAFVYMKDGVFQWAVLKACGNPITATPVQPPKPTFVCDDLTIVKVNGLPVNTDHAQGRAPLRVAMKAKGSVTNAKITGYIFNFGDGSPNKVAQYNTVAHTYTQVDNYTATVRIKTTAGTTAVIARCSVTISVSEVPPPPPSEGCIDVIKEAFDTENNLMNPTPQFVFRLDGGRSLANGGDGRVRFNDVSVGAHRVTEGLPSGWKLLSVTPAGGRVTVEAGENCAVVVFKNQQETPPPPPPVEDKFVCRDLKIVEVNGQTVRTESTKGRAPLTVKFEAKGAVRGGEIEQYIFDFGDGKGTRSPDEFTTHTYAQVDSYRATVQIDTTLGTTPVRGKCAVTIQTTKKPVTPPEETPPTDTPPELPNTGAGAAMATLFGSGSLGYGIRAFRRSRQSLAKALLRI